MSLSGSLRVRAPYYDALLGRQVHAVAFFCVNLAERLEKVLGLLSKDAKPTEDRGVSGIGSYLDADEDAPRYHADTLDDTLEGAILALLREDPSIPQAEIAERVGKSLPTVKRAMKRLSDADAIRRVGGKRFGKWEINHKQ